ncbi:acyltransferase family protein [Streptomyces sp. NBC_01340]|uniref:acyltransferase family protein n=1 Tax=unclassified Streptomyces TaxID=2593676 RepID=UPI0022576584|nr:MULTISPECIES: acyltransferase family protein [unclassified Streptomyces]MCX4454075.1 acyltransferase family protein [Streptomyces sp. NBC_01719]MCX4493435.1 acyltransferase family protein [Streptomyces sp. NBC_01728]WSI38558.1 acyltransferase family protein [Streptomyces sp. NBC_01340]
MTNSLRPNGPRRAPLPPAEPSTEGVATSRSAPSQSSGLPSQPAGATAAAAAQPGRPRDAFFDNAKYLAIVLVAMGHAWEPLKGQSRVLEAAYMVVYAFHMPAFIIISGYFSRSFDMRADRLKRLVTGVAVPYVVFEVAYVLFKRWADDDPSLPVSLLDPWFLTWFLCALFIWRLTTPLWKLVRWPLPLAIAVAMLATTSPSIGDDLDLQRTLQFLPFFVLGLCMKPEHFQLVRRREVRILSVPVFAAALVVSWWAVPRMNPGWFYHRDSAQELGVPWWVGPVMVLALLGCSLLLTACFFAWVPRRKMWFTALGAGTLYGYLLHGFLVKGGDYWGWFDHKWLHRPLGEIFVTLVAGAAVTLLCTAPVRRVFRFAMEPSMEWAFKRDATELARERAKAPA